VEDGAGMLSLRFYGDPVLRKVAEPVDLGALSVDFLEEMGMIMYAAKGIGLAAPQIGISKRFFIYDVIGELTLVLNPEILARAEETESGEEGCLSFPGVFLRIPRATGIKARYFDQEGKEYVLMLEGLEARVFQHEFDHLNGKLFIDYLSIAKRRMLKPDLDEIKKRSPVVLNQVEPVVSH